MKNIGGMSFETHKPTSHFQNPDDGDVGIAAGNHRGLHIGSRGTV